MKKNSKKKALKRAGFTLVELIVVIVILGILTAVAVPTYTGYIKRANDAKVLSELSTILTAAQSCAVEKGTSVTTIKVGTDGAITVTCAADSGSTPTVAGKDLSTYASNVGADGKIESWSTVIKGSSYESSTSGSSVEITWSNTTSAWNGPDSTTSPSPT